MQKWNYREETQKEVCADRFPKFNLFSISVKGRVNKVNIALGI